MQKDMPAGGKREGAGRPKGEPTATVTFRVDKRDLARAKSNWGRHLNKEVSKFIKKMANKKPG